MVPPSIQRVIAPSGAALQARVLERAERDVFWEVLSAADAAPAGSVTVLLGDGGAGKSVLLGWLLDRYSSEAGTAVTVVACGDVQRPRDGTGWDAALGGAIDSELALTVLLTRQAGEYQRVVLLVDTLDLLLSAETIAPLAELLRKLADRDISVIATCRRYEFEAFLREPAEQAPSLTGRLRPRELPPLKPDEVRQMARLYVEGLDNVPLVDRDLFIGSLEEGVSRGAALRSLCASPLLLSLTCQTFAPTGAVPADLSVSALFDAYWQARVLQRRGQTGLSQVESQEDIVLLAARMLLLRSTTGPAVIIERKDLLASALDTRVEQPIETLARLISEGILLEGHQRRLRFFHQNFGEYAMGRWLRTQGADADRQWLIDQLGDPRGMHLLPVARYTLLGLDPDDVELGTALIDSLAPNHPETVRVLTAAAVARRDVPGLRRLARQLSDEYPALLPAMLDLLADAPGPLLGSAAEIASALLGGMPEPSPAARTGARLLLRLPEQTRPAHLKLFLEQLERRRKDLPKKRWLQLNEALLGPLVAGSLDDPGCRALLRADYVQLGGLGRRAVLQLHLSEAVTADEALEGLAVSLEAPPVDFAVAVHVDLLLKSWASGVRESRLHLHHWLDVLGLRLQDRDWFEPVVQSAAALAVRKEDSLAPLVDLLWTAKGLLLERTVATARALAELDPARLVDGLLSAPSPSGRTAQQVAAGVLHAVAEGARPEHANRLRHWLVAEPVVDPRSVLPALVRLAKRNPAVYDDVLVQCTHLTDDAVNLSTVTALATEASVDWLDENRLVLGALATPRPEWRRLLARIDGRLAPRSSEARERLEEHLFGLSSPMAKTAAKALQQAVGDVTRLDEEFTLWLPTLVRTQHAEAARVVARLIVALSATGRMEIVTAERIGELLELVRARLLQSVKTGEDPQIVSGLVDAWVAVASAAGLLTGARVDEVLRVLLPPIIAESGRGALCLERWDRPSRSLTERDPEAASAFFARIAEILISPDVLDVLSYDQVKGWVTLVLDSVPSRSNGNIHAMRHLLVQAGARHPELLAHVEAYWPRYSEPAKAAVAEAVLELDGRRPHGRAQRLARRADCPDWVAHLIEARLLEH